MKIIKVPFSNGGLGKTLGCEEAPDRIVMLTEEFYLNESGFKEKFEVDAVEVDQANIETTNKAIYDKLKPLVDDVVSGRICVLGGDHSITYAAFKAFASKHNGAGLVVFDAHPDCEGDMEPPTHEDYLRVLVKDGIADRNRVIVLGVRNWTGNEKEFMEQNGIRYFNMKQIQMNGLSDVMDTVTETVREWDETYLSIDIDACDPAFAPGTGYIEPGGLTSRELIYAVQRLKLLKNIRMIDLVEVNPKKDRDEMTTRLAAKLLVEMS
ncbi:TPA: arginase family protein [Candidatus Woesearchaeota archaeon]|nr:arginase family protein [Candidatus Woesearchaeota archaeon]